MDGKTLGDMPAMPVQGNCVDASGAYCGDVVYAKGITLRQHYAGLAMAAFVASFKHGAEALNVDGVAKISLMQADALLAALTEEAK